MAYANILDQILDDLQPSDAEVGLKKASAVDTSEDDFSGLSRQRTAREDWRGRGASAITGDGILAETVKRVQGKQASNIEKRVASNKEVVAMISDLFHLGMTPSRVAAEMEKQSELLIMQKGLVPDTIKAMSGTVGYAYIEPNHYNSCQESLKNINTNGRLAALSVKKIAACNSCSHCNSGHCSLYKRPIVASVKELEEVLKAQAAKMGKKASKSAFVAMHERSVEAAAPTQAPAAHLTGAIGGFSNIAKLEEAILTKEHIASAVEATPIMKVYETLLPTYGKTASTKAVGSYLNSLKTAGTRVDISKVDCGYLKGKLASGNAVVGVSKCASCTHRQGMHCGLTGGTLMSFPGMDSLKSSKKAHAGAKDGNQVYSEYQLEADHSNGDVDVSGFHFEEVQSHGPLTL
jgi:hypothetical protein